MTTDPDPTPKRIIPLWSSDTASWTPHATTPTNGHASNGHASNGHGEHGNGVAAAASVPPSASVATPTPAPHSTIRAPWFLVAGAALLVGSAFVPFAALQVLVTLPLLLLLPGHAIVVATLDDEPFDDPFLMSALCAGISIAAIALLGLAIGVTPVGLTKVSTVITISALIGVCAAVRAVRDRRVVIDLTAPEPGSVTEPSEDALRPRLTRRTSRRWTEALQTLLLVGALSGAAAFAIWALMAGPGSDSTVVFALRGSAATNAGPIDATDARNGIEFSITNSAGTPARYEVIVDANGARWDTMTVTVDAGSTVVMETERAIPLSGCPIDLALRLEGPRAPAAPLQVSIAPDPMRACAAS